MEKYQPKNIEQSWYETWESNNYFAPQGNGTPFSIAIPPPNVTGTLHMGHAFQHSLVDSLIRYRRMKGDKTLWQMGTDHAGISMRRGYWFIPKHIEGIPGDVYGATQPKIPLWLKQKILRKRLLKQIGDPTRLGLPMPDHELFETHPLLNDQILHYLRHGDLTVYKDIERLNGDEVIFKGGVREKFDEIILATGYTWSAPFLPDDVNLGQAQLRLALGDEDPLRRAEHTHRTLVAEYRLPEYAVSVAAVFAVTT